MSEGSVQNAIRPRAACRPRAVACSVAGFAAAIGLVAPVAVAHAQGDAPAAEVRGQGLGFPVTPKARLHVGIDTSIGYDTNPFRAPAGVPGQTVLADAKAAFRPGLELNVPGSNYAFDLRGGVHIVQFFGTEGSANSRFGGDVGAGLMLGSGRSVVGFELIENLTRTPSFFAFGSAARPQATGSTGPSGFANIGADEYALAQWYNRGLANFVLRPGGGALEVRLGYGNEINAYDDTATAGGTIGNPTAIRHLFNFETKLRFLPRTALVLGADLSLFGTNNNGGVTREATPINASVGVQGQLTERLQLSLRAGYSDALVWNSGYFSGGEADTNIRTPLFIVGVDYDLGSVALGLGYVRNVRPIIFSDAFVVDAFRAKVQWAPGNGRLVLTLGGQAEIRTFATKAGQFIGIVDARAEFWFFEFLRAGLSNQLLIQQRSNDADVTLAADAVRNLLMAGIGLYY